MWEGLQVSTIQVRVVQGDALALPADVLVLKYAQGLHGVDREAALRLSVDNWLLPKVGAQVLLRSDGALVAGSVLFLGVPPLHEFDYEEIRVFGRRAVAEAAAAAPDAAEIALTL